MDQKEVEYFIEAALLAAGRPLSIDTLQGLFDGRSTPEKSVIRAAVKALNESYEERGIEIAEVASGFRMQVKTAMADRLGKLWEERPPRYSRALFETLALIAYRQPITRAEIEEVRGVSVSSNIMRSLVEREWVRVVGHRDVPGRPAMFGTTKAFLDYFSLKKLDDLPELADLSDWESLRVQLDLPEVDGESAPDTDNVTELNVASDGESVDAPAAASNDETAESADEAVEAEEPEMIVETGSTGMHETVEEPAEEPAEEPVEELAADAPVEEALAEEPAADVPPEPPVLAIETDDEPAPVEAADAAVELPVVQAEPEPAQPTAVTDDFDIPELTEQTQTDIPDIKATAEKPTAPTELPTIGEMEEELQVSEWPDPVDASSIATLETADTDPEAGSNR